MSTNLQASNRSLCRMYGCIPHPALTPHDGYTYCERCGDMIDAPHEADDIQEDE